MDCSTLIKKTGFKFPIMVLLLAELVAVSELITDTQYENVNRARIYERYPFSMSMNSPISEK